VAKVEPKPAPRAPEPRPQPPAAKPAPPPAVAVAPAPAPTPPPTPAAVAPPAARYTPPPALGGTAAPRPSASSSGGGDTLDQARVEATFAKHRASFDACMASARANEPNVSLDGRTVHVTMTVNPNGKAAYPTLDDVELNGTELGNCLKRESGKMQFPAFGGDPIRVSKPIVLK
jgi:hypothetical protein